jgi:hypothetical protein
MVEPLDGTEITEALIGQMAGGANWVERRDAASTLTLIVRQSLLALRKMAEDKDPDVAHECKKSVATITSDLTASTLNLETELSGAMRTYRADRGSSSAGLTASRVAGAGAAHAGEAGGRSGAASGSGSAPGASRFDLEAWLRAMAKEQGGELKERDGQWAVEFRLSGERRQTIFVDPDRKDSSGQPVAVMYTLCGPAEPKVFAASLNANAQLSHAAFAMIKQGETRRLVLISRRRMAELTRENVAETLAYLAKKGDRAESQLQAEDEH